MVEPAVPFYGLRFRIFESEFSNKIEPEVRFRHFAHTMGSMLINKVQEDTYYTNDPIKYDLNRPNSSVVTTLLSVREIWGSNPWLVKSDTASPTARHRCDVFFGAVLRRR